MKAALRAKQQQRQPPFASRFTEQPEGLSPSDSTGTSIAQQNALPLGDGGAASGSAQDNQRPGPPQIRCDRSRVERVRVPAGLAQRGSALNRNGATPDLCKERKMMGAPTMCVCVGGGDSICSKSHYDIDYTHIKVSSDVECFIDRKHSHPINVHMFCDAERSVMQLTNIVARWPGSTHDLSLGDGVCDGRLLKSL